MILLFQFLLPLSLEILHYFFELFYLNFLQRHFFLQNFYYYFYFLKFFLFCVLDHYFHFYFHLHLLVDYQFAHHLQFRDIELFHSFYIQICISINHPELSVQVQDVLLLLLIFLMLQVQWWKVQAVLFLIFPLLIFLKKGFIFKESFNYFIPSQNYQLLERQNHLDLSLEIIQYFILFLVKFTPMFQ